MKIQHYTTFVIALLFSFVFVGTFASAEEKPTPPPLEERINHRIEQMTKALDLTEDQQKVIRAILETRMPEIDALHEQTKQKQDDLKETINAMLTKEQREKEPPRGFGPRRGPGGPGFDGPPQGSGARGRGPQMGRGFGPPQGQGFGPQHPPFPVEELDLTEEQIQKLEEWKAEHALRGQGPRGANVERAGRPGFFRIFQQLDLTDEQKEQVREILKDRPEDPIEAVKNVLTSEQQTKLEELKNERPFPQGKEPFQGQGNRRGRGGPQGGPRGGGWR